MILAFPHMHTEGQGLSHLLSSSLLPVMNSAWNYGDSLSYLNTFLDLKLKMLPVFTQLIFLPGGEQLVCSNLHF